MKARLRRIEKESRVVAPLRPAMAKTFQVQLVHGDAMLAKWTTSMDWLTLETVRCHLPDDYKPGAYKIKVGEEECFQPRQLESKLKSIMRDNASVERPLRVSAVGDLD